MNARKLSSTNYENERKLNFECPFIFAISLMGKRWKPAILWKISQGFHRFGQLRREIPPISQKMLTQHLRELERDELITRTVYAEVPPRVEYALTDLGHSLEPILQQLNAWGEANMKIYQERFSTKK